jgi:hypothetical protein
VFVYILWEVIVAFKLKTYVLKGSTLLPFFVESRSNPHSFCPEHGTLVLFHALISYIRSNQESELFISISSGMVSGILSKTRSCPRRYKPIVREIFAALGKRTLEVDLDTTSPSFAPIAKAILPTTLELLRQAYFADHPLEAIPAQTVPCQTQNTAYGSSVIKAPFL